MVRVRICAVIGRPPVSAAGGYDPVEILLAEIAQRAEHRVGGRLAEAAEAGVLHQIAEHFQLGEIGLGGPVLLKFGQQAVDLGGAHPAGNAFAAGLVHAELHEIFDDVDHARGFVNDDHSARSHDRSQLAQAFIADRGVQVFGRDAAARGTAGLNGLEGVAVGNAAADIKDDLAQGHAHGHLDQAGMLDFAGEGKDLGAFAFFRAQSWQTIRGRAAMISGTLA